MRLGDVVEIVANSSIHEGMPHKTYHGRTGIVYNVSKRAVGVEVNKVIRNRREKKRVNVRIEHIRPSKCRQDFLDRVKRVDDKLRAAKLDGKKLHISEIKRFPTAPKAGFEVSSKGAVVTTLQPIKFDDML